MYIFGRNSDSDTSASLDYDMERSPSKRRLQSAGEREKADSGFRKIFMESIRHFRNTPPEITVLIHSVLS